MTLSDEIVQFRAADSIGCCHLGCHPGEGRRRQECPPPQAARRPARGVGTRVCAAPRPITGSAHHVDSVQLWKLARPPTFFGECGGTLAVTDMRRGSIPRPVGHICVEPLTERRRCNRRLRPRSPLPDLHVYEDVQGRVRVANFSKFSSSRLSAGSRAGVSRGRRPARLASSGPGRSDNPTLRTL